VLHRRDIIDRAGIFAALEDDGLRSQFDTEFLALVGYLPGPAFTVSIDKQEHLEKYKAWQFDPYHYVLTCLVERYALWLNRHNYVGDVVGEARTEWHDGRLRRAFRHQYDNGSRFLRPDVAKSRLTSRELRLRPKTADVAGLQVADLLAHPAHRTFKFMQQNIAIPDDYGAALIRELEHVYDRNPVTKLIKGYGRKWLP
jgi:hypothetical protein